jgi:hypothetical protein
VLADHSISSQRTSSFVDSNVRRTVLSNLDNCSPLSESRTQLIILLSPLTKAIKTPSLSFIISFLNESHSCIHLDSGQDTLILEMLGKGDSSSGALTNCLIIHDSTSDILVEIWGRVKKLSVTLSISNVIFKINFFEALSTSRIGFVRGKDTLAFG